MQGLKLNPEFLELLERDRSSRSRSNLPVLTPSQVAEAEHPLPPGTLFYNSEIGSIMYQVEGTTCRLYDREQLPWPSCSLQWRGKQPSWNRIGARFVPDLSVKRYPSYRVKVYENGEYRGETDLTLFWMKAKDTTKWWYTPRTEKMLTNEEAFWNGDQG